MDFVKEAKCAKCDAVIKLRRTKTQKHLKRVTTHSADGEMVTRKDTWYCEDCWNAK